MSDVVKGRQEKVEEVAVTTKGMIDSPKHDRRYKSVKVLLEEPDDLVREQVGGFINFIREHAVVGVAIGFIVGLQAQTLIKQLITSFVTPLLTLLLGNDLQNKQLVIHGTHPVEFAWGAFVYTFADFLVVLLFIYVVVKVFRLDKLDKVTKK